MPDTEYQFRPCDCCEPPAFSQPTFTGKYYLYECSNKCGLTSTNISSSTVIGSICPYTAVFTVNVEPDVCTYYSKFSREYDYTVISTSDGEGGCETPDAFLGQCPDGPNGTIVSTYTLIDGECELIQTGCGGGPGNSRSETWTFENPITDCEYKLYEEDPNNPLGYSNTTNSVEALEYISRIGNVKEKSITVFEKIRHAPTATCYLKVWVRTRIQKWKLPPRDSDSWEPPNYQPFAEDPECEATEGPDWEDNPCYRKVVEDDPFCCNDTWDSQCQTDYENCLAEFVPPPIASGPCEGPFIEDGDITEEGGQEFIYEWEGSGNPCYSDDTKVYYDEANIIEGDIDWSFEVLADGPATGKSVEFEMKYSIVRGYEPIWPSERSGPNDCKRDEFPRC